MTAGEVSKLLRERKRWRAAEVAGVCMRCGEVFFTGDLIAWQPFYDGLISARCCKGGRR